MRKDERERERERKRERERARERERPIVILNDAAIGRIRAIWRVVKIGEESFEARRCPHF